jgi:hypothetical protein
VKVVANAFRQGKQFMVGYDPEQMPLGLRTVDGGKKE